MEDCSKENMQPSPRQEHPFDAQKRYDAEQYLRDVRGVVADYRRQKMR